MTLKSTICSIVHHVCRTQAYCPAMVSTFKLSSGTASLPTFYRIASLRLEKNL